MNHPRVRQKRSSYTDSQFAVSQNCILRTDGTRRTICKFRRTADYKSAIRQSATLRYFRRVSAGLVTSRPALQGVLAGEGASQCSRGGCAPRKSHLAFSLIEMIGALAVIAILAAILVPPFVRQMDKVAGDDEGAALKSLADALQQSILRKRSIPSHTDWAWTVATELGVDMAAVTTNPRGQPRHFLIDPALQVGVNGGGLPYTQSNSGSVVTNNSGTIPPVSPRVLILSSIGEALPAGVSSGVATAANFTNIWNSADGTVPPAPVFSGWAGGTNDLKVQRVDLSPLFVRLLLSQNASPGANPRYSIDSTDWASGIEIPKTNFIERYYIQNSVLALYNNTEDLDSQQILIRNNSFVYDQNVWRGSIGGEGFLSGLDIASVVDRYMAAYPNVRAQYGANQQAVVVQSMINFMDRYDDWATAGFPSSSAPTHVAVQNAQAAMKAAVQGQYLGGYNPIQVNCQ